MKRLISLVLLCCFCFGVFPSDAVAVTTGADNFVFEEIREYRRGFWYPEDDGKLGIPAAITTCYKGEAPAPRATPTSFAWTAIS